MGRTRPRKLRQNCATATMRIKTQLTLAAKAVFGTTPDTNFNIDTRLSRRLPEAQRERALADGA